jgi:hypothetical protein
MPRNPQSQAAGTAIGASIGSIIPGVGTVAGGLIGGFLSGQNLGRLSRLRLSNSTRVGHTYQNLLVGYWIIVQKQGVLNNRDRNWGGYHVSQPFAFNYAEFLHSEWKVRRPGNPGGIGTLEEWNTFSRRGIARIKLIHTMSWFDTEALFGEFGHILKTLVDGSSDNETQDDLIKNRLNGTIAVDDPTTEEYEQAFRDMVEAARDAYTRRVDWGGLVPNDVPVEPGTGNAHELFVQNRGFETATSPTVSNEGVNQGDSRTAGFSGVALFLLIGAAVGWFALRGSKS